MSRQIQLQNLYNSRFLQFAASPRKNLFPAFPRDLCASINSPPPNWSSTSILPWSVPLFPNPAVLDSDSKIVPMFPMTIMCQGFVPGIFQPHIPAEYFKFWA